MKGFGFLNKPVLFITSLIVQATLGIAIIYFIGDMTKKIIFSILFLIYCILIFFFHKKAIASTKKTLLKVFSLIRHDYQNQMQIIMTMIQLKKYDKALAYINKSKNSSESINSLFELDYNLLCYLLEIYYYYKEKGFNINIELQENIVLTDKFVNKVKKLADDIMNCEPELKDLKLILGKENIRIHSNKDDRFISIVHR